MPLFLQALPLSLKTLWRYLAVLPALCIIALLMLLAAFLPVIGLFVPGVVYAYCLLVGFRCALAARGIDVDPGLGFMLLLALGISVLTMVVRFAAEFVAPYLSGGIMLALRGADLGGEGWISALLWLLSAAGIYGLILMLWSAALAVPTVAALANGSRHGAGLRPVDLFATGIGGLLLISLVWFAGGNLLSVFGEVATMFLLLFETILAVIAGEDPSWDWSLSPFSLLGGTLYMAWASSWFFSAAVLYWEHAAEKTLARGRAATEAARVTGDDLRALREARMPKARRPD